MAAPRRGWRSARRWLCVSSLESDCCRAWLTSRAYITPRLSTEPVTARYGINTYVDSDPSCVIPANPHTAGIPSATTSATRTCEWNASVRDGAPLCAVASGNSVLGLNTTTVFGDADHSPNEITTCPIRPVHTTYAPNETHSNPECALSNTSYPRTIRNPAKATDITNDARPDATTRASRLRRTRAHITFNTVSTPNSHRGATHAANRTPVLSYTAAPTYNAYSTRYDTGRTKWTHPHLDSRRPPLAARTDASTKTTVYRWNRSDSTSPTPGPASCSTALSRTNQTSATTCPPKRRSTVDKQAAETTPCFIRNRIQIQPKTLAPSTTTRIDGRRTSTRSPYISPVAISPSSRYSDSA